MTRIAPASVLSVLAAALTISCSTTPMTATPTPTPTPQPTPTPPPVGSLSVGLSPSPLHAGEPAHFAIGISPDDAVSALSIDFGDAATAVFGAPISSRLDVSHSYRLPGTYNATVVATAGRGAANLVVVVRVEP